MKSLAAKSVIGLLIWVGFLSLSCLANAPSSKENKPQQAVQSQSATNAYQGITEAYPLFVKVEPSETLQEKAADKTASEDRDRWDRRMAQATIALSIITLFLAFFTGGLWYHTYQLAKEARETSEKQATETQESLRIAGESAEATKAMVARMKDTAERQLRAYIGITRVEARQGGVTIKFINNGSTPARNVFMYAWPSVALELTAQNIRDTGTAEKAARKVGGTSIWHGIETEMHIDDPSILAWNACPIFVCGYIFYEDVFGEPHHVCCQFRMELGGSGWKFTTCFGSNTGD